MFGGGSSSSKAESSNNPNATAEVGAMSASPSPLPSSSSPPPSDTFASGKKGAKSLPPDSKDAGTTPLSSKTTDQATSGEKRSGNGSPPASGAAAEQKKRRSSGVGSKASSLLASAKNTLNFGQTGSRTNSDLGSTNQTPPLQKLGKQEPALTVRQGQHNNSAGESLPGPRSTFRVGVWEDRNKKCRRTMEDTHAFLYNFLHTPAPAPTSASTLTHNSVESPGQRAGRPADAAAALVNPQAITVPGDGMAETDNGYFAIFDGHAGTFAADWCGKKLHIILEETIRKNPNLLIPEILDQTFTAVDKELERLPVKNSGCTAAIAVLRWEDRVPCSQSVTGSQPIGAASAAAAALTGEGSKAEDAAHSKLRASATRQRVLYTANVGDARIILCRSGKALRLSYDHKGSDENEGRRIANAGGLILNNRVNGVLAVTRALGDTYMKDLVTGHPYTTETVIQPEMDEFIIIACDGLWDVCDDQEAVDRVRNIQDPAAAAKLLVDHALARFSTDNLSCMIIRFDKQALLETTQTTKDNPIGVEGDLTGKIPEADKIVNVAKQKIADCGSNNSGRGHDGIPSITEEPSVRDSAAKLKTDAIGHETREP